MSVWTSSTSSVTSTRSFEANPAGHPQSPGVPAPLRPARWTCSSFSCGPRSALRVPARRTCGRTLAVPARCTCEWHEGRNICCETPRGSPRHRLPPRPPAVHARSLSIVPPRVPLRSHNRPPAGHRQGPQVHRQGRGARCTCTDRDYRGLQGHRWGARPLVCLYSAGAMFLRAETEGGTPQKPETDTVQGPPGHRQDTGRDRQGQAPGHAGGTGRGTGQGPHVHRAGTGRGTVQAPCRDRAGHR